MIHFDTNFLIQTVVAGSAAHGKFRAWTQVPEDCNASSIAWAEFCAGRWMLPPKPLRDISSRIPNRFCPPMPCWQPDCSTKRAAVPAVSQIV